LWEVWLDDPLCGLVDIWELKKLRLLLVEQVGKVLDAVLELCVKLGPVVALKVVGDDDCPLVFLRLSLVFDGVWQKVNLLGDLQGFFTLGFGDLSGFIVLGEDSLLSNLTELLVEMEPLLVVRLAISRKVDCVNGRNQLGGATEFVLNKLLFGLLHTQASHILSEAPHGWALVRAEHGRIVIIGRINSLDFDGFVAEVFKLKGKLLFNGLRIFILLPNRLGEALGVLGGALGRVEAGDEARDGAQEYWAVSASLGGASRGCLVASAAYGASRRASADARFIENCVRV
jgi:hypothetical protein